MKNATSRTPYACALLLVLWTSSAATAASPGAQGESLTLARAIELATTYGPTAGALTAEIEALTHRSEAESLPPTFSVEAEFENFGGRDEASGTDALESTVRLSRIVELGGKADMRRRVGSAELDRLAAEQSGRRGELAAEVARRFIHLLADQATFATAARATELARRARDVARERVNAGASSPAAVGRAEIALARAQIAQEHAEHELASSRVKLSVLWGDPSAAFAEASGDLFELSGVEPFDVYRARLDESPDLARLAMEAQLQDARLALAQAQRAPNLSLSAGVRRLETFDDEALVAAFSVPLGTRRRADLQERAARAESRRIELDRQTRRLELHATLFELYQEMLHARTEATSLHERVRPQAEAMVATTDQGYRAGRFSLLELTDAQLQLIDIEREAIRAAAQFHTFMIEIQRVVGTPIRTLAVRGLP